MIILKYSDINTDDILFTKTFNNNNNISIKCYYLYQGKKIPLVIQTPEVYMPFGISNYNHLDISLNNNNQDQENFKKLINNIDSCVKLLLKKRNISGEFKTNLKYSELYPDRLKLYIDNDTTIFDNKMLYLRII